MLDIPKFLRTPPLYEESTATVSWENTGDADNYELDAVFNETFEQANKGKSWNVMDGTDWTWADQTDANGKDWDEIAALPAQGLMWRNLDFLNRTWAQWDADLNATWDWMEKHTPVFTVYKGPGDDVPAPDQGLDWNTIEVVPWAWGDQNDPNAMSWKEISLLPSVGLNWQQHDSDRLTWDEFEAKYDNWLEFETQATRGLCWESLDAKRLDWDGIESLGENGEALTWEQMERLAPDNQTHKGCEITIPLYSKFSMLRVRAVDDNGNDSGYIITGILKHLPRSLANYVPPCLHVPVLCESKPARIVWGELYGATGYVIERKIDSNDWEIVFDGMGESLTKKEWQSLRESDISAYKTWLDTLENDASRRDFGTPTDDQQHYFFDDTVPLYGKKAQYRIRGYNSTDCSKFMESAVIEITPLFIREDNVSFIAVKGQQYMIQLCANEIEDYGNIVMSLKYDPETLQLEQVEIEKPATTSDQNIVTYTSNYTVASYEPGETRFQLTSQVQDDIEESGFVLSVRVKALKTCDTNVSLS